MKNIFKTNCIGLLFFLLAFSLSSCVEDVTNVKIPKTDQKFVISGFISPQDTMINIAISLTTPALGFKTINGSVKNATVTLSTDKASVVLSFNTETKFYSISPTQFPIVAGETYYITVATPDGNKAEGSCTVPVKKIDDFTVNFDSLEYEVKVKVNWMDLPGMGDYYRVKGVVINTDTSWKDSDYPWYYYNYNSLIYFDKETVKDTKKDEGMLTITGSYYDGGCYNCPEASKEINISLHVIDNHYFNYYESYNVVLRNYGDPFAEPTMLYTNINGGYGIFAAHNYTLKKIK